MSKIFEIESLLHDPWQGDNTVTGYFTSLARFWQQLDMFEVFYWKCPEDDKCYRGIVEKKMIFKFLSGLNNNLDDVGGLPNLPAVFSEVWQEESRRKLKLDPSPSIASADGSALTFHCPASSKLIDSVTNSLPTTNSSGKSTRQGQLWCEKYKKPNHNLETCWKIQGKPAGRLEAFARKMCFTTPLQQRILPLIPHL